MEYNIETFWGLADKNLKCNTAYPIFKDKFAMYQNDEDIMKDVYALSYYIHVPFCKQLCGFCEYTKFKSGDIGQEKYYLELLSEQIENFLEEHTVKKIYGLDIGGGTPTSLTDNNFEKLLELSKKVETYWRAQKPDNYEKSIEFSFSTINKRKLELIHQFEFNRISAGIQSMDINLIKKYGREYKNLKEISDWMEIAHNIGIEKINLDLMYGMPGQTVEMIEGTLKAIELLHPEQVTLYEMRFNRVLSGSELLTRDIQYEQYTILYNSLIQMGYKGRFGANTFSLSNDNGVSSYLWYRMSECVPYKGFGISAQSMSMKGISYGSMKNTTEKSLKKIEHIKEEYNYILPKSEIAAKYVSIAMYSGCFRLDTLNDILTTDARQYYADELEFLITNGLVYIKDNIVYVTNNGFRYYGAICALFWSEVQKKEILRG